MSHEFICLLYIFQTGYPDFKQPSTLYSNWLVAVVLSCPSLYISGSETAKYDKKNALALPSKNHSNLYVTFPGVYLFKICKDDKHAL